VFCLLKFKIYMPFFVCVCVCVCVGVSVWAGGGGGGIKFRAVFDFVALFLLLLDTILRLVCSFSITWFLPYIPIKSDFEKVRHAE
jgi:hypothetical protein